MEEHFSETFLFIFRKHKKNLNIPINNEVLEDVSMIQDPIIAAIEKYKRNLVSLKSKSKLELKIILILNILRIKNGRSTQRCKRKKG